MWDIYDRLIETVDDSIKIRDFVVGVRYAAVLTEDGVLGVAPVITEKWDRFPYEVDIEPGMSLSEMVASLKAWNYHESALALAALNAFHNRADRLSADAVHYPGGRRSKGAFFKYCEANTAGKRTVMIEPPYEREEMSSVPGIYDIVRRDKSFRDYMFNAYEELIPQSDQVLLSGMAIVDKLLSPVLKRAENHRTIMWGLDVPITTAFADAGVAEVTGFIVDEPEKCMWAIKKSGNRDDILKYGHFATINLEK
ncbi:MAG: hypothetical protein IKV96_04030 [Firmicutes bacterium]|nr:hypothetical protein [Bacillota bacterium]